MTLKPKLEIMFIWLALVLLPNSLIAHPVSSEGTLSIMGDTTGDTQVFDTIYSVKYYWGLGVKSIFTDEGKTKSALPMASLLVKRINAPSYQANFYVFGGLGHTWFEDSSRDETSYLYGTQLDWETRRYYVLFKHAKALTSHDTLMEEYQYRVGIAPYLAKYEEINTWFILQASNDRAQSERYSVTPIMRLFYKNILTEFGRSNRGESIFNFMVHYYF